MDGRRAGFAIGAYVALLVGCETALPDQREVTAGDVSSVSSAVTGTATTGFPQVVYIEGAPRDGVHERCNGILISPQHVLTAAHCVVPARPPASDSIAVGTALGTRVCFGREPLEDLGSLRGGVQFRSDARCTPRPN